MNERDETDSLAPGTASEPATAALNKSTLVGCGGILLVLSLPALFFLPLERLHIPSWIGNLIPLLAIGAVALGAYLLLQVPSEAPVRSHDPQHPLTSSGKRPILEQPAARSNRIILLLEYGLVLCAVAGYGLVSFGGRGIGIAIGTLVISVAGYGLLIGGNLAARRRVPVPAWRWVHLPVQGTVVLQALPMMTLGLVLLIWSLILGVEDGSFLLTLGLGLLVVAGILLSMLYQRLSPNHSKRT
ncbi:MAG: hypothetical protein ACLQUY_28455 [Ktedonobacterales bacterium]